MGVNLRTCLHYYETYQDAWLLDLSYFSPVGTICL